MRPPILIALACAACATAGLRPGEDCASLADSIAASRAHGDDKTADLDVERLARACPDAAFPMLEKGPTQSQGAASLIHVEYRIDLDARDHLTRLALTYAGRRLAASMPLGTGELEVAADLLPAAGQPVHLIWTRTLAIDEPELLDMTVEISRGAGDRPYVLDVVLPPGLRLRELRTIGRGGGSEKSPFAMPLAGEPPFEAPPELREAGAPPTRFVVCPVADGTIDPRLMLEYRERLPHPRHLGAALDWLRATHYQPPPRNEHQRFWCIIRTLRWDRTEAPTTERGVGESG